MERRPFLVWKIKGSNPFTPRIKNNGTNEKNEESEKNRKQRKERKERRERR